MSVTTQATKDAEAGNYSPPRGPDLVDTLLSGGLTNLLYPSEEVEADRKEYDVTYQRVRENMKP